ncbi:MAG: IF-2-associated domain-containing protein, partial [Alteraurantiacibacter sp.]|nr:IF-2-associated domain-containing protein [Alteraurantiacibacter sp.]
MSDNEDKPQRERKPLGLKRSIDAGEVKQTFSHGRTNKVVVEVKQRRFIRKPGMPEVAAPPPPPPAPVAPPPPPPPPPRRPSAPIGETPQERVARLQREAEEERLRLAEEARRREDEERLRLAEEERRRAEQNRAQEKQAEEPAAAMGGQAEEGPQAAEPPAEDKGTDAAPEELRKPAVEESTPPPPRRFTPVERPETKRIEKEKRGGERKPMVGKTIEREMRRGKLTVNRALNEDEGARARSLAALKRAREKERRAHYAGQSQPREKQVR